MEIPTLPTRLFRPSTPRSSLIAAAIGCLLASLAAFGCHAPDLHAVRVDLSAVASISATEAPASQAPSYVPQGLPATPAKTLVLEGAAATQGESGSVEATAQVLKALEEARRLNYNKLVQRLRRAYQAEAEALRDRKLAEFEPTRRKVLADALAVVSKAYVAYGDKKGPLVAKLSTLVGFPDPDPHSLRKIPRPSLQMTHLALKRAIVVRQQIAVLDSAFQVIFNQTFAEAQKQINASLTQLEEEIAAEIATVDQRAQDAAKKQVEEARANLAPLFVDEPAPILPATPSRTIQLPGAVAQAPIVAQVAPPSTEHQAKMIRLQRQLHIWLGLNGYRLTDDPHATDATSDFIQWLNEFRPGASG